MLKMCKTAIFEVILFYEENGFSHLFSLNKTQMLVYFDIEI
jgi:hypothetical protein